MNTDEPNKIKKRYSWYTFKPLIFLTAMFFSGLITYFIFKKPVEKCSEDKARYVVISYNNEGHINQTLFCSEARMNEKRGEVVCTDAETQEVYILSYPVSIKNVTYTTDYLKYVNEK